MGKWDSLFSGEESACQFRGHGFNPWSRKIPHALGQLSLCATTIEAHVLWGSQAANYESSCT